MHTALNRSTAVLMNRCKLSSTSARLREKPGSSVPASEVAAGRWRVHWAGAALLRQLALWDQHRSSWRCCRQPRRAGLRLAVWVSPSASSCCRCCCSGDGSATINMAAAVPVNAHTAAITYTLGQHRQLNGRDCGTSHALLVSTRQHGQQIVPTACCTLHTRWRTKHALALLCTTNVKCPSVHPNTTGNSTLVFLMYTPPGTSWQQAAPGSGAREWYSPRHVAHRITNRQSIYKHAITSLAAQVCVHSWATAPTAHTPATRRPAATRDTASSSMCTQWVAGF